MYDMFQRLGPAHIAGGEERAIPLPTTLELTELT